MAHYEVEVKSLLGKKAEAESLKGKMCELDPSCECTATSKQLNHYFKDGDIHELYKKTERLFGEAERDTFKHIVDKGDHFSVRTRLSAGMGKKGNTVLLVVKASVDEGTSENTVSRLEFEEPVELSLDELDTLVRNAGFIYQAKWSREREEFSYKGANVCLDKNAGYGYLAEFEKIIENESELIDARKELDTLMHELGVEELQQDRLERMFEYYNKNWPEYYGTDKTFTIE